MLNVAQIERIVPGFERGLLCRRKSVIHAWQRREVHQLSETQHPLLGFDVQTLGIGRRAQRMTGVVVCAEGRVVHPCKSAVLRMRVKERRDKSRMLGLRLHEAAQRAMPDIMLVQLIRKVHAVRVEVRFHAHDGRRRWRLHELDAFRVLLFFVRVCKAQLHQCVKVAVVLGQSKGPVGAADGQQGS